MKFIGIDGCKAGWFYVGFDYNNQWSMGIFECISEIAELIPESTVILIDIPIGLRGNTGMERLCDIEARYRLKPKRSASVFPVPSRLSLQADHYEQASALNFKATGRKLSKQTWNITHKIKQVDDFLLNTKESYKIREMHPELCFWALNNHQAMQYNKKTLNGLSERKKLLGNFCQESKDIIDSALSRYRKKEVAEDDILDALIGAVTARFSRQLTTLPQTPEKDEQNLPMEVVFADIMQSKKEFAKDIAIIKTPAGLLRLEAMASRLAKADWLTEDCQEQWPTSQFLINIVRQVQRYWTEPDFKFSITKIDQGTVFMNKVWHALDDIPSGETRTYGDLAKLLNTSPRAIGNACRNNPIPLFVPCHRVVSATGIGGYDGDVAGEKLSIKRKLLAHEQKSKNAIRTTY